MRTITPTLKALEQNNVRSPVSRLEFYRIMPVWSIVGQSSASYVPQFTPSKFDSVQNAVCDADIYNGRFTLAGTTSGEAVQKFCYTEDFVHYTAMSNYGIDERRMSVDGQYVYGINGPWIQSNGFDAFLVPGSSAYHYPIAIAGVSRYALYLLVAYPDEEDGDFSDITALGIIYASSSDSGATWDFSEMDYVIPVPDDYKVYAGNFFDAVRLDDGTDVILVNLSNYGDPRVILRRNAVWSTPYHVLPIDIVDNYSYLRLGWLKCYDGVIYATGSLGRAGSTGTYAQEMGVVLRSTDGLRWSMDRYRYLGTAPFLSPLVMDDDYMYYIKSVDSTCTIYRAERTPVFGCYNHKVTVTDDILGWQCTEANHGNPGAINIQLANAAYNYSTASCSEYIQEGDLVRLYAGYEDVDGAEYMLLNTYGIDQVVPDAQMQLTGREWAYRQLKDVAFDQDWQWLSQTKHHDTCVNMGGLYSIGDAVPTVGTLDIENDKYNKLILLPTAVRPQGDDFGISGTFYITNDHTALFGLGLREASASEGAYQTFSSWSSAANAEANDYVYTETLLGTGFGVFGYCSDQYNLVAAFCDVINAKLYLLRRTGNSVSDASWEVLNETALTETPAKDQRFVVSMRKVQSEITIEAKQYELDGTTPVHLATTTLTTRYIDYDAGKLVGVIEYLRVPESASYFVQTDSWFIPRDYNYWKDSTLPHNAPADRFFEFTEGYPLLIGEEVLTIQNMTHSQWATAKCEVTEFSLANPNAIEAYAYLNPASRCARIMGAYPAPSYAIGTGESYWGFAVVHGTGVGKSSHLDIYNAESDSPLDPGTYTYEKTIQPWAYMFINAETGYERVDIQSGKTNYVILPGFAVLRNGYQRMLWPGDYYNPGERILQHFNDVIHLCDVQMYDLELDKSMDWALKDVAAKAGILHFAGAIATDDSDLILDESLSDAGYEVLPALYNDFTVHCALHSANFLYFTLSDNGTDATFSVIQPTDPLAVTDNTLALELLSITSGVAITNCTITLNNGFLSLWSEERLIFTVKLSNPYKVATDSSSKVYLRASAMDITQYELYRLIDGIIADQGMAAFDAAMRVIRDARIKLLPTPTGGIKLSAFKQHPDLGTVPDIIYALQEQFSDRVPTHIRAVGAEIAEYFDHAQAAKYGILFHTLNIESLGEEESYREAIDTVRDALSYSEGILQHVAAQLEYEVEDQLEVQVETYDGRTFNQTYIIDSIERTFGPATLEMTARCRRKYDV